ncbi:hypothetical protein [Mesorhizobium sp. STM 4661]|uniref:hypothetical protein n=1 Tax=Mesorhizobium sp. STM 4661 TaxID=1297570 RepID=UPI00039DBBCF|nr:hypothetical protein [Mesorhizobium sp. STM 4661]
MADVANMHRDYLLYIPGQSLVGDVEIVSSARGQPMGYRTGRHGSSPTFMCFSSIKHPGN